jgi:hypothetical protein
MSYLESGKMRTQFLAIAIASSVVFSAFAQEHTPQQIAEDALRHRALAQAQELSAQCFVDHKGKDACLTEMKGLCTGLAVGKFCGLREEASADPAKSFQITAKANKEAAQCMESGKAYEDCQWNLQTACHGLGIGKFCGMVHSHS